MYSPSAFASESHGNLSRDELRFWHKRWHCPDTSVEREETKKSNYDSQPSVPQQGNTRSVCQEDTSPSFTAERLTTIEMMGVCQRGFYAL